MRTVMLMANESSSFYSFRLELIDGLLAAGYHVQISLPYGKEVDLLVEKGCEFIDTPLERKTKNPFKDLALLCRYLKILRKHKPDVVLTFTIKPNIYGSMACALRNIPYITNITGLGTATGNKSVIQNITVMLYKFAMCKVAEIFFQNKNNMEFFLSKNIRRDKGTLIPGSGVSLGRFSPQEYPSDDTTEFIFMARIMKEKGIDQYLETAKQMRIKYPKIRFHILGSYEDTSYQPIIEELMSKGIVEYHGKQFDTRPFVAKSHCTIHPSFYPEGISNVLLESEASCRPVITTDNHGCQETVDDGVTGFIVPMCDTAALINAVEKFINLPYEQKKQMGLNARAKVVKEFDRQTVVNKYLEQIGIILK